MDKLRVYQQLHTSISFLQDNNALVGGDYYCPLCLRPYSIADVKHLLTEEDVPQRSLGGEKITITCPDCNHNCGSNIDFHLKNTIELIEQKSFLPGTDRQVRVIKDGQQLNATLKVGENKSISLDINTKINAPNVWTNFKEYVLLPENIIDVQDKPIKHDERRVEAALLKNAYLILFSKTGYAFLMDHYYDVFRSQILNPDKCLIPEGLWTIQNLPVPDGIYYSMDNRYRGFFVIYSLKLVQIHRVCVLIPTPNVPLILAATELRKIQSGTKIHIRELPDMDFLTNDEAVTRLRSWVYGWNMIL